MPDAITLPGTGESVATEVISNKHLQRMKLVIGAFGSDNGDIAENNPLPTSDVTAQTKLDTVVAGLVALLSELEGKTDRVDTQPVGVVGGVVVSGTVDVTGVATAANQAAGNSSLSSIDGKLPALSGGKVSVTDPTALPLPSGAATATKQDTYALDSNITGQAGQTASGQNIVLAAQGTGSTDVDGFQSIAIQIIPTGTVSSGVVTFEGSNDGTTFVSVPLYDMASLTANPVATVSPATGVNRYFHGSIPFRYFRARISTIIGGGGSIAAVTRLLRRAFVTPFTAVTQATAANLLATVSATNLSCNAAQIGGQTPITAQPQGSTNRAISALVPGSITNTDYSAQAWAAASGSGATISPADGTGAACAFDVNVTAWSAGSSVGLDIYLQESPDNGTTWYDIWQCVAISSVTRDRIPAIPIGGRRRMRWVNRGGAATTATVTVTAMSQSVAFAKQVQWFDRTSNVTSGTAGTGNGASFDIAGCTKLTCAMQTGTATAPASFKIQMSMDGTNWYDASAATSCPASSMTVIPLTAGVYGRFGRFVCTTAGTSALVTAGHVYGAA